VQYSYLCSDPDGSWIEPATFRLNYGHPDIGKKGQPERGKSNRRRRTEKEETGKEKQETLKEEEELGMKNERREYERCK
jgi:hypothetical protein